MQYKFKQTEINMVPQDWKKVKLGDKISLEIIKPDIVLVLEKEEGVLKNLREIEDKEKIDSTKHIFGTIDPIKVGRNFEE